MVAGIGQVNNGWGLFGLQRKAQEQNPFAQGQGQGLYESEKVSGSIPKVGGSEAAGGIGSVQKAGADESLVSRLGRVNGELTPDTRNAMQGQRLYLMA